MPRVTEVVWTCDVCLRPINKGDGYVEMPRSERNRFTRETKDWQAAHPKPTDGSLHVLTGGDILGMPQPAKWNVLHKACDPEPEASSYFIDVERINDIEKMLEWCAHFHHKKWITDTDWDAILYRGMHRTK